MESVGIEQVVFGLAVVLLWARAQEKDLQARTQRESELLRLLGQVVKRMGGVHATSGGNQVSGDFEGFRRPGGGRSGVVEVPLFHPGDGGQSGESIR